MTELWHKWVAKIEKRKELRKSIMKDFEKAIRKDERNRTLGEVINDITQMTFCCKGCKHMILSFFRQMRSDEKNERSK